MVVHINWFVQFSHHCRLVIIRNSDITRKNKLQTRLGQSFIVVVQQTTRRLVNYDNQHWLTFGWFSSLGSWWAIFTGLTVLLGPLWVVWELLGWPWLDSHFFSARTKRQLCPNRLAQTSFSWHGRNKSRAGTSRNSRRVLLSPRFTGQSKFQGQIWFKVWENRSPCGGRSCKVTLQTRDRNREGQRIMATLAI